LNPEYEKHLEFTVCAVVQPNRWVSEHVRLKKPHAQTTQLAAGEPVTGRVTNRLSHLRSADASIIRMALAAPRLSAYIHVDAK